MAKWSDADLRAINNGTYTGTNPVTAYARRIARNIVNKGQSRSKAGGKGAGVRANPKLEATYRQRYNNVIRDIRNGKSFSKAAKDNHISTAKVKQLNNSYKGLDKIEGKYIATYTVDVLATSGYYSGVRMNYENMQVMRSYWNTVINFIGGRTFNVNALDVYKGFVVYDTSGVDYTLETDMKKAVKRYQSLRSRGRSYPVVSP